MLSPLQTETCQECTSWRGRQKKVGGYQRQIVYFILSIWVFFSLFYMGTYPASYRIQDESHFLLYREKDVTISGLVALGSLKFHEYVFSQVLTSGP